MKNIVNFVTVVALVFSFSSYAGEKKRLTAEEKKWVDESSVKICNSTVPLYGFALDSYFKNKTTSQIVAALKARYDVDEKNKIFYTNYIDRDGLIEAIVGITESHSKKIMTLYPGDKEMYKKSVDVTVKESLPPVCQRDMRDVLITMFKK